MFLLLLLAIMTIELVSATGLGNALASALTGGRHIPAHLIAGFSIATNFDAQNARSEGVQTVLTYGRAYSEETALGHTLESTLHMTQIEAEPWELLHMYECHRLYSLRLSINGYCSQDYPKMTLHALLSDVKDDIEQDRLNENVVGVWVLDDWPASDPGSAAAVLPQIAKVIHLYAPNIPTICGFGASLLANGTGAYYAPALENFTPSGCDEVALYIYSAAVTTSTRARFDWSMQSLLPKLRAGLEARGWNPQRSPWIGIAQAFGGERTDLLGHYVRTPTASDIALESESFCKAGASGIAFYAWYSSGLAGLQSPANNPDIERGVREGIANCQRVWGIGQSDCGPLATGRWPQSGC